MDLLNKERLKKLIVKRNWDKLLADHGLSIDEVVETYHEFGQRLKPFMIDSSYYINQQIDSDKRIIMEGAQGTMLDVDHGTYPFVTSSNPISGGACIGAGIGPHKIHQVIGVTKAYVTRVGEGPFPTELTDDIGQRLRDKGAEYGTTTNRPRRCGWLDLVGLRYAIRVNGLTEICLTKLDVLDGLESIKVCTAYKTPNGTVTEYPLDQDEFESCTPIYDELPGWNDDISQTTSYDQLPENAKKYIEYLVGKTKVNITLVSVGSRRKQTIHLLQT